MLVDLTTLGWYLQGSDGEPVGPFSKGAVFDLAERGAVDPNNLIRHSTQADWRTIGEEASLVEGLPARPAGVLGAPSVTLEESLPREKKARLEMARGDVACWRHGTRQAVHVCQRCQRPVCERCVNLKRQHIFCKKCQTYLHNWRVLAGLVDFWLIPVLVQIPLLLVMAAVGMAAAQGAEGTGPRWGLMFLGGSWAVNLLLLAYYLLKDGLFTGRSIGKIVSGVQAIDLGSRAPIGLGKSALRNLILQVPAFIILPLQLLIALGVGSVFAAGVVIWVVVLNLGIWLFELALMYRAPLMRRLGDRIGGTRVVDHARRLEGRRRRWQAKWSDALRRARALPSGELLEVSLPAA